MWRFQSNSYRIEKIRKFGQAVSIFGLAEPVVNLCKPVGIAFAGPLVERRERSNNATPAGFHHQIGAGHAVHGREGCVSFGFLVAPSVATLKKQLRELHDGPLSKAASEAATRAGPHEA